MGNNKTEKEVLLDVQHLKKYFEVGKNQTLKAVDDVTLQIYKGETLGLVGESGCGKSTFGRTVIHLYEPTSGTVTFDGMKVDKSMSKKQAHDLTGRMQMIFQDPYASLNPRRKIMDIVGEGLDSHGLAKNRRDKEEQVVRLLETVGLQAEHATKCPGLISFSGGCALLQRSVQYGQREANLHSFPRLIGLGSVPSSMILFLFFSISGSGIGIAESSALVYG